MDEEEYRRLISEINTHVAKSRWRKAGLRARLIKGQQLKMSRITKRGQLLCSVCDQAMTRDGDGNYIHVNHLRDKHHGAKT